MPKKCTEIPTKSKKELYSIMMSMVQEGCEKAEEIDIKTEEEFNTLKQKIVEQEMYKIDKIFDKKKSQFQMLSQIKHGKLTHDLNMKIVDYKMKILEEIKEDSRLDLIQDMEDNNKKQSILKRLILESLYKILEKEVMIKCREIDEIIIRNILPEIEKQYENATKSKITIYLDDKYLLKDSLPGILIRALDNKISIFNSLDERLEQIMKSSLPVFNHVLFSTFHLKK